MTPHAEPNIMVAPFGVLVGKSVRVGSCVLLNNRRLLHTAHSGYKRHKRHNAPVDTPAISAERVRTTTPTTATCILQYNQNLSEA